MDRVYISWESPAWLYKKRDKEFFKNVAAIVFFLIVILFFAREFLIILAILSLSFLLYVFNTIRPHNVFHKITSSGIETDQQFYPWRDLNEFWFERQWEKDMMVVSLQTGKRITMILENVDKNNIKEIMIRFLPMREESQKSFADKASHWLSRKIPLENQGA
ncbi:MAG: hypothetical protein N3A54_02330 [Patescibacteria group bacterium]|nr:hypothetical protein [Patescibacteria group bacterium]